MSEPCREFERLLERPAAATEGVREWEEHLRACPECELQWEAHRELQGLLVQTPAPRLSRGFSRRVAEGARLARTARIMRAYWLGAALLVALLFQQLDWASVPTPLWALVLCGLGAVTAVSALPLLGAPGRRMSLLDLVVETVVGA